MIHIPGHLSIRTISGRNGDFNVGRLATSIGEFIVKDALLDQYQEGKYQGHFVITQISPSSYTSYGRTVIEVRARLDSMTLDNMDALTQSDVQSIDQGVQDPLDEEVPKPPVVQADNTPFAPTAEPKAQTPSATPCSTTDTESQDEVLFGTVWPLGVSVKLDTTVDRQQLRHQSNRLTQLGYRLDFKNQVWHFAA